MNAQNTEGPFITSIEREDILHFVAGLIEASAPDMPGVQKMVTSWRHW